MTLFFLIIINTSAGKKSNTKAELNEVYQKTIS